MRMDSGLRRDDGIYNNRSKGLTQKLIFLPAGYSAILQSMNVKRPCHPVPFTDPRGGFINLYTLAVIVLVLLFTGAGRYLWQHALQLGSHCQSLIAEVGLYEMNDTCMAIGTQMATLRNRLEQMVGETRFGDYMDLEEFSGMMARQLSSQALGFSSPQLSGLIDPGVLGRDINFNAASAQEKLRLALTHGNTGHNYLSQGNGRVGLPYLQSSAGMGEYGVLSQLSLGSAYLNGNNGIPRDLPSAYRYNSMALNSIRSLEASGTPEANSLLRALPAPSSQMQRTLEHALDQIKHTPK